VAKKEIRRKVVRTNNKDELDCYKLRTDTTYQYTVLRPSWCRCCVWSCFRCPCLRKKTEQEIRRSEEYSDVACVEDNKEKIQSVVNLSQSSKFYSDSVEKTKQENDAVLSQDLNNLPRPNIKNKISTSVPAAKDATTNFKIEGSAESLDENESKPISQSKPISLGDKNGVKDGLSSLLKNAGEELGTIYKGKMPGADANLQKLPRDDTEFASDDDYVTSASFVISSTSLESEKVFSCLNMKILLGNLKPEITNYTDEFCGDPSEIDEEIGFVQELTMDHKEFEEPYKNLPFGTVKVLRKYQAKDRCLQESNLVEEIVYVTPEPPKFNYSQTDEIFSTSIIDSFLPYGKLAPTPYSECGYDVDLLLDTDEISLLSTPYEVEKEEECGVWKVSREWSASLNFYDYETFFPSILSLTDTKVEQYFYARDDEKPIFMDDAFQIPEVLKIPFHDNYVKSDLNAPMAYDISKSFLSTQLKLIKKNITLTSEDGNLAYSSSNFDDKDSCLEDGIAYFNRTWTAADACGNYLSQTQRIIIDHPNKKSQSTNAAMKEGFLSIAPGVSQSLDPCAPFKILSLSTKTYKNNVIQIFPNDIDPVELLTEETKKKSWCPDGAYDENNCRIKSESGVRNVKVFPVPPEFDIFPEDITLDTGSDTSIEITGEPSIKSICLDPFEVKHNDVVLSDGDEIKINRHWILRPKYDGCQEVIDPKFIKKRTQVITISNMQYKVTKKKNKNKKNKRASVVFDVTKAPKNIVLVKKNTHGGKKLKHKIAKKKRKSKPEKFDLS